MALHLHSLRRGTKEEGWRIMEEEKEEKKTIS